MFGSAIPAKSGAAPIQALIKVPAKLRAAAAPGRHASAWLRRGLLTGVLLAAPGVIGSALAQTGPFVYVPGGSASAVSIIDTATNTPLVTTIPVGNNPFAAAVRGDGSLAYVTNQGTFANSVSVINTGTNAVIATIPVGTTPKGIALTADGTRAYVANKGDNTVSVIDTATNAVLTTFAVGTQPAGVAVSPDGQRVYVTNEGGNSVTVTGPTGTPIATVAVGTDPRGVIVRPDGQRAYVINNGSNSVSVIDTTTNTVTTTIAIPPSGLVVAAPTGVSITPDGQRLYVVNSGLGTVSIVNTATNLIVDTVNVGGVPNGITINASGGFAYVTNLATDRVNVVPIPGNTVLTSLDVSAGPNLPGTCVNGNALLATGATFVARTPSALQCTGVNGPIFTGGTLQIALNGFTSSLAMTLQSAGGTVDTGTNTATLSGALSGAGGLTKIGAGTLILSGPSTYLGATTISAGTLQGGAANAFSASSATIVNAGATLNLGGFNQQIGSLAGAGSTVLGANALTTGGDGTSTTFAGVISGVGGSLDKIGAGTFTLSGNNTYTGPTTINGGTLVINGSIVSPITVSNGGILGGNATLGPTTIAAGGTIAPGNSIGAITVNGPLIFAAGSIYTVEANAAGQSDLTRVNGAATISGGTVNVLAATGTYLYQTTYTILTASGGVAGVFSSVNSNLAFLTPVLSYDANDVFLTLFRNDVAFTSVAQTDNQRSVAAGLQLASLGHPTGNGAAILNAIVNQSAPGARAAYDALSGEGATGAQQTAFGATSQFMSTVMNQSAFWREGTGQDPIGITLGGSQAWDDPSFLRGGERPRRQSPSPATGPRTWRLWTTGFGGAAALDGDAQTGSADLSTRTAGLAAGLDYQIDPAVLIGIAAGGTTSSFSVDSRLSSGTVDGGHVGLYATARSGPLYLTGTLGYDRFEETTQRYVVGVGPTELAKGKFASNGINGRVETGWKFPVGSVNLTPFAAMQAAHLWSEGFAETSATLAGAPGILGLAYDDRSVTSLPGSLGLQIDTRIPLPSGMTLTQSARAAWVHEFQPDRSINPFLLSLPAAAFHIDGAQAASDAVKLNAGLKLDLSPGMGLYPSFDAELSGHSQSYAGSGGFKITW